MKAQLSAFAISAIIIGTAATPVSINTSTTKAPVKVERAQDAGIAFFRVHRQGKAGATATWGLTSNAGVTGFLLQRTYEDPTDPYANWENISSSACNGSRSYKYTDENVFPGFISYRVVVIINDGREVVSEVATVHIVSH